VIILYPRPYRLARVEVAWSTWRDLHPKPMAGYEMLRVVTGPWWARLVYMRRGFVSLNLGIGALKVFWRRVRRTADDKEQV
jgi:hypothetical protein